MKVLVHVHRGTLTNTLEVDWDPASGQITPHVDLELGDMVTVDPPSEGAMVSGPWEVRHAGRMTALSRRETPLPWPDPSTMDDDDGDPS